MSSSMCEVLKGVGLGENVGAAGVRIDTVNLEASISESMQAQLELATPKG
jgi:hypothetical protein